MTDEEHAAKQRYSGYRTTVLSRRHGAIPDIGHIMQTPYVSDDVNDDYEGVATESNYSVVAAWMVESDIRWREYTNEDRTSLVVQNCPIGSHNDGFIDFWFEDRADATLFHIFWQGNMISSRGNVL